MPQTLVEGNPGTASTPVPPITAKFKLGVNSQKKCFTMHY